MQVVNINDIYLSFQREKRRYDPSLFCIGKKTKRKRKEEVSLRLFRKIVLEYLSVYFYDFYMTLQPIYFPLGGFLKKVIYPKWVNYIRRGTGPKQLCGSNNAIGLFWFLRPSLKMFYMVKINKLTGSSNRLPKLEKKFTEKYNKDLLPIFKQELKKAKDNKTLFTCTQT